MNSALITGASSGVGAAFAQLLAQEGHQPLLVGRNGERLAAVARAPGTRAALVADLTDEADLASVEALAADAAMVVNNAGVGWYSPFARLDPRRARRDDRPERDSPAADLSGPRCPPWSRGGWGA